MTNAKKFKVQLIPENKDEKWAYVGNAYENKNVMRSRSLCSGIRRRLRFFDVIPTFASA